MAADEEPSPHSICSKNASPFSGGSGTGNCHHEGLAALQSLGLSTQFYAYSLLRNQFSNIPEKTLSTTA
jgi:hypothetical protein